MLEIEITFSRLLRKKASDLHIFILSPTISVKLLTIVEYISQL